MLEGNLTPSTGKVAPTRVTIAKTFAQGAPLGQPLGHDDDHPLPTTIVLVIVLPPHGSPSREASMRQLHTTTTICHPLGSSNLQNQN
jgi:hypothetical protein